jgi:hypothetical protein
MDENKNPTNNTYKVPSVEQAMRVIATHQHEWLGNPPRVDYLMGIC